MSSTYTDTEKAAALVALELCERRDYPTYAAAELTGINRRSIERWEAAQLDDPSPTIHNARVAIRSEFKEEVERLRGLLREAREYLTPFNDGDHGCADGECPECDMLRLGLRIDAELGAQP